MYVYIYCFDFSGLKQTNTFQSQDCFVGPRLVHMLVLFFFVTVHFVLKVYKNKHTDTHARASLLTASPGTELRLSLCVCKHTGRPVIMRCTASANKQRRGRTPLWTGLCCS